VDDLGRRLHPQGFVVEKLAPVGEGVELIIGCRWDPHVGPVLLVGMGGILAEAISDVRIALAPAGATTVEAMVSSLRARRLLQPGGSQTAGFAAACEAAVAMGAFGAGHPEVSSVEVNPLLVTPRGALCLDARIDAAPPAGSGA
jgi:succinyl-CoA synthetase beta subunit